MLAAFAQVQSLTETLNEYIKVSTLQEISAVSTSLCENCYKNSQTTKTPQLSQIVFNSITNSSATTPTGTTVRNSANLENFDHITDDDGYCDIDEIRFVSMLAAAESSTTDNILIEADAKRHSRTSAETVSDGGEQHLASDPLDTSNNNNSACENDISITNQPDNQIETNETYISEAQPTSSVAESVDQSNFPVDLPPISSMRPESCSANRLIHAASITPAVPCQLILGHITTLSLQISQLLVSELYFCCFHYSLINNIVTLAECFRNIQIKTLTFLMLVQCFKIITMIFHIRLAIIVQQA